MIDERAGSSVKKAWCSIKKKIRLDLHACQSLQAVSMELPASGVESIFHIDMNLSDLHAADLIINHIQDTNILFICFNADTMTSTKKEKKRKEKEKPMLLVQGSDQLLLVSFSNPLCYCEIYRPCSRCLQFSF